MEKTIDYYLSLPYTREVIREEDGKYFVRVKELPNCMSQGDTAEDALHLIDDAMRGWLEVELEDGEDIPEPERDEDYSGKFVVRVPRSLHRRLVQSAENEGVSLNTICVSLLDGIRRDNSAAAIDKGEKEENEFQATLKRLCSAAGLEVKDGNHESVIVSWLLSEISNFMDTYQSGEIWKTSAQIGYLERLMSTHIQNKSILILLPILLEQLKLMMMLSLEKQSKVGISTVLGLDAVITQVNSQSDREQKTSSSFSLPRMRSSLASSEFEEMAQRTTKPTRTK